MAGGTGPTWAGRAGMSPLSITREVPEPGRMPGRPARPGDPGPAPPEPAPIEMSRQHVLSRRRPPPEATGGVAQFLEITDSHHRQGN